MKLVLPGILEKEWSEIEKKIQAVQPFTNEIHIDLLDGKFAQNTTFLDPQPFKKYSDTIFFELHMMVEEPLHYLKPWADAGFKRFIGHIEKMPDITAFVAEGELLGEVGLAIDAGTPLEKITVDLDDLDCLLVMTVNAGLSAQRFLPECLEKVKQLRLKTNIPIEVDGGIHADTIVQSAKAGANRFVSTSALFSGDSPGKLYKTLATLVKEHIRIPPATRF